MATAKKKSTKKTTTRKSAGAKSSTKKTAKEALAPVSTGVAKASPLELLRRFHLFSAAVSLAIAVVGGVFLNSQTADITVAHVAKDTVASSTNTVLGPAYESFATIEIRYIFAAVFVVSAILSLLLATKLRSRYEAGINSGNNFLRWLVIGVNSALILEFTSIITGIQDIFTLKLVAGLVLTTSILGWFAEQENSYASSPRWNSFALSIFTGVLAWLPLLASIIGTYAYSTERFGWHVYAIALAVLIGFSRIALTLYNYIKYPKASRDNITLEDRYLSTDLFTKLALAAVVFIAFFE